MRVPTISSPMNRIIGISARALATLAASTLLMLLGGRLAKAQVTGTVDAGTQTQLEEVVVTGLYLKQNVQSAPVSTTVYTQAALEDARITNPYDLIALTPSLSISQSQGVGVNMMTLRGIRRVFTETCQE